MIELNEYPTAIAKVQKQIFRVERKVRYAQAEVDRLTADIEKAIAFDSELKNEIHPSSLIPPIKPKWI
jgi:peptidoglycan hydrolase CwlO-like protein